MKPTRWSRRRLLLATAAISCLSSAAYGQSAPDKDALLSAAPDEEAGNSAAPVIVVQAQKRAQGLAEVPISIASLGEETLEAAGANDVASVSNLVPNFNIYEGFDRSEVAINVRGLTSGTSNPGIDPSVGFFIDGVYIARPAALTGKLIGVERFEVLRGPQGTLYGRNTSAGAVNVYTKDPDDEFVSEFLAGYGSYDLVDLRGRLSGPLGEFGGVSFSGYYGRQDSYLDDALTGRPLGQNEDYGFRGKLVLEPTPEFSIRLIGDYSKSTSTASRVVGAFYKDQQDVAAVLDAAQNVDPTVASLLRFVENVPLPFSRDTLRSDPEADDLEQYGVSAQIDWDTGPVTITSITAYRESEDYAAVDPDFTQLDLFLTSVRNEDEQFSQELRIASNPVFGRFDFLLGLFYYDASFSANTQTQFGVPLFARYNATMPADPITRPQSANSIATQDTEAFAVFGQLSYEIVDDLTLTYGFRYNDESKAGVTNQNPDRGINSSSGIPFPLQFPVFLDLGASVEGDDWINMASLNYEIDANSNVYATYAEGVKSGGINASILLNTNGLTFEKESSTSYEIGYRNVFGNGLRLNLAAFYTTFRNLQVQTFDPTNPANIIVENAGEAEIYGVEGDLFWPIAEGLEFNLAAAYNHSEYVDTVFPGSAPVQNPAVPGVDFYLPALRDADGLTLSRAPEFTLSSGLQYTFALSSALDATLRADYSYSGSQYLDAILSPESEIDGFSLVNLRASIRTADGRWQLSAYAKNVLDQNYYTQIIASPAAAGLGVDPAIPTFFGAPGAPRVIGIEIRKSY